MNCFNRPKKFLFFLALLFTVCFLMSGRVFSQTTLVTIEGIVADEQANALPGASVTVRSVETGYLHSTITRADGSYIISGIQPGKYEVEISISGFAKEKRSGLTFNVGAKISINFALKPATLEEEITVTAESPIVEVTKSEVSRLVDRQKIEDLPLLSRNFGDLTILAPGVIGGRTNALPTGIEEILIDGMSNENIIQNTTRLDIPADAIQEFRVMTNAFEAEYGNTAGMIRTAITRSGSNDFKGRLAYFYRDEVLDTPNYFVNHAKYKGDKLPEDQWKKAPFIHHNPAGYFGGPIKKDKAHFFLAYEGFFRTTYDTITSPLVPRESIDIKTATHEVLLKLSYQLSEKHLFSFRYSTQPITGKNLYVGGLYTKERATERQATKYEFQLNWTYYPSDSTMNEVRAIYVKDDNNLDPLPEFADKYDIVRPSGYFGKYNNYAQYNFATRYQFVDNFSIFLQKHAIKAGFDFIYAPSGCSVFDMYIPGEYSFTTDKPFDPKDPKTYPFSFTYNKGEPAFTLHCFQVAAFIQDSWRIHPKLTLNYGLRYNWFKYTGLDLDHGLRNLNPRFGFSWDPLGDGKTSVRGGIGTYTTNVMANIAFPAEFYKDVFLSVIYNPGYPDPFKPNPFVSAAEAPIQMAKYQIKRAPSPYALQTTLGVQRELFTDFSVGVDFVWTKGYDMITWKNENPVIVGTKTKRADPTTGDVWDIENAGKSDFKGLYLNINKRYSRGWALDVAYTLGKQMGNTERQDRPWSYDKDAWDRAWGRKDTDARHQLAVSGIVAIPFGFQLSSVLFYRSEFPWNAIYYADKNLDSLVGEYVDQNRNSRKGFDYFSLDFRISKYIKIDRFSIQLFGEAYNVTNRTNFYNVYNRYGLSGFGEPRSAYDPRLMQMGVRFGF